MNENQKINELKESIADAKEQIASNDFQEVVELRDSIESLIGILKEQIAAQTAATEEAVALGEQSMTISGFVLGFGVIIIFVAAWLIRSGSRTL